VGWRGGVDQVKIKQTKLVWDLNVETFKILFYFNFKIRRYKQKRQYRFTVRLAGLLLLSDVVQMKWHPRSYNWSNKTPSVPPCMAIL
jgi:hypothetical protein